MRKFLRVFSPICALLMAGMTGVLIGTVTGCGSGNGTTATNETRSASTNLTGTWRLVGITGGLSGQGMPVDPSASETLTFSSNTSGTVTRRRSGQPDTQKTYQVVERRTIFSTNDVSVLVYQDGSLPEVVGQANAQQLQLQEEAADGFSRWYERVSSSGG